MTLFPARALALVAAALAASSSFAAEMDSAKPGEHAAPSAIAGPAALPPSVQAPAVDPGVSAPVEAAGAVEAAAAAKAATEGGVPALPASKVAPVAGQAAGAVSAQDAGASESGEAAAEPSDDQAAVAGRKLFDQAGEHEGDVAGPAAAALSDEQLKAKIKPTVRGLRVATFQGDEFKPQYEARLRALGADVIDVDNPSAGQLAALGEDRGYFLTTNKLRWVAPLPETFEQYIAPVEANKPDGRWPDPGVRANIRTRLKKSKNVDVRMEPLSPENYEAWYPIWQKEVGGKPGGHLAWKPDFARTAEDLPDWTMLTFRMDGKIVGGAVLNDWKERGFVTIGAAAYDAAYKGKYELSVRTFAEAAKKSRELGYHVISYGADMNGYGYDFAVGLHNYKTSVGMIPYPEGTVQLRKLVNADKLKAEELKNKLGESEGYLFYALDRGSDVEKRYLQARAAGQTPAAKDLLGGLALAPGATRSADVFSAVHYVDGEAGTRAPDGFRKRRLPLP